MHAQPVGLPWAEIANESAYGRGRAEADIEVGVLLIVVPLVSVPVQQLSERLGGDLVK
jgi:hypothetical protein